MRVTDIDIVSAGGVSATLDFKDPSGQNPYLMKNIYGLDADEINRKYVPSLNHQNYMLSMPRREIVMRIVLNPNFASHTYSDLRDDLYKVISSSRSGIVTLNFNNDGALSATIDGYVTKFEVPLSQQTPELQITLECAEPLLKNPIDSVLADPGLQGNNFTVTDSASTAAHGIRMGLTANSVLHNLWFGNNSSASEWKFEIDTTDILGSSGFQSGDAIHVRGDYGNRAFYIVRSGTFYNLAHHIKANSQWPMMFPGDNEYYISPSGGWTLDYLHWNDAFWGV